MIKLFISYRSLDSVRVDAITERLNQTYLDDHTPRYEVWQDKKSIPEGHDWWISICEAIETCQVFVFMVSHESVRSKICLTELSYAQELNRPILPVVLAQDTFYNPVTGNYDIDFWNEIPLELTDLRAQFLFEQGATTFPRIDRAVDRFLNEPHKWRKLPAERRQDPRKTGSEGNNSIALYDEACEYAARLEFETARRLFQILVRTGDAMFGQEAGEWIELLYAYRRVMELDSRASTRHKTPAEWERYRGRFPLPFIEGLFDPKGFAARYGAAPTQSPTTQADPVGAQHAAPLQPTTPAKIAPTPTKPRSVDLMPAPFAWIDIPGTLGKKWEGEPYKIAKYPVTNAQYRVFVDTAKGYTQKKWWTDAGWAQCEKDKWTQPRYWTDKQWNGAEQPVVGVSWYEAVAFCLWLSEASGERIMLPTDDQWQYAAQGDDGRVYPWGNDWDCQRCNNSVKPCDSSKTTPVRQYEGKNKGDSFFGVTDMAGNVWEWCLTDYNNKTNDISSSTDNRGLRGGSWFNGYAGDFRCDFRGWNYPRNRGYGRGFRLSRS